ncbi:glycosyltransferase [bacterium]|nr:glycosyltransferase [bacterium]
MSILLNPDKVKKADIVVGIPSYNEADSISFPTEVASKGLKKYFGEKTSCIINVDNSSPDNTKDAFLNTKTDVSKIYISTGEDTKGKGRNLRNLFSAALELQAEAIVVVDADLKSITPHWIRALGEPLYQNYDYVCPIYIRHKYDGTITNNIVYPMLRTLYGIRVRQPIGGDFGVSGKLARAYMVEKCWDDENVLNFGIDIWMTIVAIARRFNVCQTFLGSPKIHRVKDPGTQLGPMFTQVISTLFQTMVDLEYLWKYVHKSQPGQIYGFGLGENEQPPPVEVNKERLFGKFKEGFSKYKRIWGIILPQDHYNQVKKLLNLSAETFYFPSDFWARILFNAAVAFKNDLIQSKLLSESLIPFYFARTLSFVNKTEQMDTKEAEEYLEEISRVFENEKGYLVEIWDAARLRNGKRSWIARALQGE